MKMMEGKRIAAFAAAFMMLWGVFNVSYAGKSIQLKDVNSTNYFRYVKTVKAAYGYNKGECKRKYLPHEEHFYSEYYDHWNVDVVYDRKVIRKLYTKFEKAAPGITSARIKGSNIIIRWKGVDGARKYVIKVKRGGGSWKILNIVDDSVCRYADKGAAGKNVRIRYRIYGIKHVRLWDVKSSESEAVSVKSSLANDKK